MSFSLPVALQESTYSIASLLGMFVIVKLSNYGEIGIYSATSQWGAILLFVLGALRNVALSYLSGSSNDTKTNKSILKKLVCVNLVATLIPFLILSILANYVTMMYGESYQGMQGVLIVVLFTSVVHSVTNVCTQELIAHEKKLVSVFYPIGPRFLVIANRCNCNLPLG